ncbi:MAG TPA: flagellar hook-basal body complex protein FliE [Myxococcales bacterium]|nr:flagellar hook-basal body complex protein FliE [Myxococcales bacterium]
MDALRSKGLSPAAPAAPEAARPAPGAPSFAAELGKAIDSVDALQKQGDAQAEKVAQGGGNLHETALALEKADVAMRVLTRVRNKVVEAYQEVMRMSV